MAIAGSHVPQCYSPAIQEAATRKFFPPIAPLVNPTRLQTPLYLYDAYVPYVYYNLTGQTLRARPRHRVQS